MKLATVIGIVLIILGGLTLAYRGITYVQEEEVVDFGPLEVEAEQKKTIPLSPVLGFIAIGGGIGLVLYGSKSDS